MHLRLLLLLHSHPSSLLIVLRVFPPSTLELIQQHATTKRDGRTDESEIELHIRLVIIVLCGCLLYHSEMCAIN